MTNQSSSLIKIKSKKQKMVGLNELAFESKFGQTEIKENKNNKNKKKMEYKNQGRVLNDSHDGNIFNNKGLGIYRQNKYSDVERAVFSSHTRSKQASYKLKDNLASETYGNNFSNKSKGFKNIRESSAAKYNDAIVTKLLAGSNSAHTFKSASSHTSSLKNLNRDKLHSEDLYTNNLIEEQLHSSSSAETIAIKDKVSVQNSKKLKDYSGYKACNKSIEEIQRSKAYL